MERVRRVWQGDLPLPDIFWNWAIAGGLAVNMISSAMFLYLASTDQIFAAVICGYLLSVPYNLIVTVGVFRAAEKYEGDKRWAETAKTVTLIGMLILSIT